MFRKFRSLVPETVPDPHARPSLHRMVYSRSLAHSLYPTSSRRSPLSLSRKVCDAFFSLLALGPQASSLLSAGSGSSLIRDWLLIYHTRTDPISSILFHPTEPWLITTSGTRRFQKKVAPERDWLDSASESESDGDDDAGSVDGSSAVGDAAGRSQPAMSSGSLADSTGNDDARRSGDVNQVASRPEDSLAIWSLS